MRLYKLIYELATLFFISLIKVLLQSFLIILLNCLAACLAPILAVAVFHSGKLSFFQFLNFKVTKTKGKLTIRKEKFCFVPVLWIAYTQEYLVNRRLRILTQTLNVFLSLTGYIVFCLLVYHVADRDFFESNLMCAIIFTAYSLYAFFHFIFSETGNSPKMELFKKNRHLQALITGGTPPSRLGDELSEEIELSSKPSLNEYDYILYQYFYSLEKGDTERVRQRIRKIENALPPKAKRSFGCIYNELIFYYSWLEKDPEQAEHYKRNSPFLLENDIDLNGRRVYAYYLYGRGADTNKIRCVIEEGLSVADEFPLPGNIPLETNLLLRLRDRLDGQGY